MRVNRTRPTNALSVTCYFALAQRLGLQTRSSSESSDYVLLNIPTACPPRAAVPVHQAWHWSSSLSPRHSFSVRDATPPAMSRQTCQISFPLVIRPVRAKWVWLQVGLELFLKKVERALVPHKSALVGIKCSMIGMPPSLVPCESATIGMKWMMVGMKRALASVALALGNLHFAVIGIEWMMVGRWRALAQSHPVLPVNRWSR